MCVGGSVNGQTAQPEREDRGMEGGEDTPLQAPLPERVPYRYPGVRHVQVMDDMRILKRVREGLKEL